MNKVKISVIIPVYNRMATIERAIDSVLSQTVTPYELIVVNDGSTDGTEQILKRYSDRIIIITQGNRGVSAARNAGIKIAKGDWIALLDSDDEWLPKKMEYAVEFIRENRQSKIFQTEEIWVRNGKRVNPKVKHKKNSGMIFKESLSLCLISPSAVVIKKELLDEVGGFDENLAVCEDYDLWLRITKKYPAGLDERMGIIKYGGHEDQLSRIFPVMDQYRITAMEKHLADEKLVEMVLPVLITKLKIVINGSLKRHKDVSGLLLKLKQYELKWAQYSNNSQSS
jgi:glycosyltransferase involved in cell wall biosynthesis